MRTNVAFLLDSSSWTIESKGEADLVLIRSSLTYGWGIGRAFKRQISRSAFGTIAISLTKSHLTPQIQNNLPNM